MREILVPSTRLACLASAPVGLKLGFSLLTGAPPYFVGAWLELSTPRKETSWSGRGFLLRWCGDRDLDLERLRRRRLGGGDLEADAERVRCLRSRMARGERERLSSLDLSRRVRSRERERSRLLCLSRDRSRLRSLSPALSLERSRRLSLERSLLSTDRCLLLLSFDLSRRLSLERSRRCSLNPPRRLSRDSSRGLLYGSGDPFRPCLLDLDAEGLSLGLRSFDGSLGRLSCDLLLEWRLEATEASLLARSGSVLGTFSATTRGGVGTSPLASCWVSSRLWLKGDKSLAMLRRVFGMT